jgi:hypothetical protein
MRRMMDMGCLLLHAKYLPWHFFIAASPFDNTTI